MSAGQKALDISVVIPAYDEEKRIDECLRRVTAFLSLKDWEWEVIVSSDGSVDKTEEIVRSYIEKRTDGRLKYISAPHAGKGAAARRGILAAEGNFILLTDADLSAPIKEVDKLVSALEGGCDIAIGSRAIREKGCDVQQSPKRWLAGRIFNILVRTIVIKGFKDTQCGFKCFKKEVAHTLSRAQTLDTFCFDIELLCLAKKMGCKVKEVPVMWKEALFSKVNLVKDSISMLKELFYLRKKYSQKN